MGHVEIKTGAAMDAKTPVTDSAMKTVRLRFNPSSLPQVDRIKSLAAALISECEQIRDQGESGAREATIAITEVQGACMFAVSAATAHLA
ncbi:DUF7681 family protein [Thalassovita sp.]|jgi:hypothetical protein|uniref:Acb2/Tad1 domain-containing protein n=1 Tax=Thalassovita sp. TaxID=1979401 RepID=UPI002AB10190|nr:hypothetical protein [Thalassovita sp.]